MDNKTQKQAILVLGMHRSGTSMMARSLNLHGVSLPKEVTKANEFNERGYWESLEVQKINDEIFGSAHTAWFDCHSFPFSEISSDKAHYFEERILAFLRENFDNPVTPLFALKDPRICKIFPFWQSALESFGAMVSVVISFRNPLEVADSLTRRDNLKNRLSKSNTQADADLLVKVNAELKSRE